MKPWVAWIRLRATPSMWTAEKEFGHIGKALKWTRSECERKEVLSGVVLPSGTAPEDHKDPRK